MVTTLDHAGIVRVYDVGESDGVHFFTMAFVDGQSLAERLRESPLPPREAAELVARAAEIVQFAHDHGVVHRDLKPGNILLDVEGRPHITDFGLAKRLYADEELTNTGQVLGTPAFMPPEQARGDGEIERPADVYALGAILFTALSGRAPFQAATPIDTLRQVIDEESPSLRTLNHDLPLDLETICRKCLEKNPSDRYESSAHLADDLQRWLSGEPILARRLNVMERTLKWARKRPATAALLAVSLLAMAGFGGLVVAGLNNEQLRQAIEETDIARKEAEDAFAQEVIARSDAEAAQQQLRRSDYVRRIALSRLEWNLGNTSRVDELLDGVPEENRGWEWWLMCRLNHQEINSLENIRSIGISGDETKLFVGSRSNRVSTVRIRDPESLTLVRDVRVEPDTTVYSIIANTDGSWLAVAMTRRMKSGYMLDRVERWDVATGKTLRTYHEGKNTFRSLVNGSLAMSSDDQWIAAIVANDRTDIWSVDSGERRYSLRHEDGGKPTSVDFSPDGLLVAVAFTDGSVWIWQSADGKLVQKLGDTSEKHEGFGFVKFDPTGRRLALIYELTVQIWDTSHWTQVAKQPTTNRHYHAAFDESGDTLAMVGGQTTVDLRRTDTGQLISQLHGHDGLVHQVRFAPHGKLFSVTRGGETKVWDTKLNSGNARTLQFDEPAQTVAFSSDSARIAVGGGTRKTGFVSVHDAHDGRMLFQGTDHISSVRSVAFSPVDDMVISASWDHRIGLWNDKTKPRFLRDGNTVGIEQIAVSTSGQWLVSCGNTKRQLCVWDLDQQRVAHRIDHGETVQLPIAISPNGRWLIGTRLDVGLIVWSTDSWNKEREIKISSHVTRSLSFSPDGQFLAVGTSSGSTLLIDFESGEQIRVFDRHRDIVEGVAFNSVGNRIATASGDGTTKIWDVATGEELLTLTGHIGGVRAVSFSPDGNLLATGGDDQTVRIYDGTQSRIRSAR